MLNPSDFGLKPNPFRGLPGSEVTHWAGLRQVRGALEEVVISVRPDDIGTSECVVLYGDWGAGKSHALRFFTGEITREGDRLAIYVNEVPTGSSFASVYFSILEQLEEGPLGRVATSIQEAVRRCVEQLKAEKGLPSVSDDLAIEMEVARQDQAQVKSLNGSGRFIDKVDNDVDAAKKLASIFRVMTTAVGESAPAYGAVYLFLDEMERLNVSKPTTVIAFYDALRTIVNGVTERFALVLSYTLQLAELDAVFPQFMQERLTRQHIHCASLSTEDGKLFVREYLANLRPNGFSHKNPYHPFSEEAIDVIFDREPTMIPRKILRHMHLVWERASRQEDLQPGAEITPDMASKILERANV